MTPETKRRIVEHLARVTFPGMEILQVDTGVRVCASKELGWSSVWNPIDSISDAREALERWLEAAPNRDAHISTFAHTWNCLVIEFPSTTPNGHSIDKSFSVAICLALCRATGLEVEDA